MNLEVGRKHRIVFALLLALLTFFLFFPSTRGGFVWDDHILVEQAPDTHGTLLGGILAPYWQEKFATSVTAVYARPITALSFRLQRMIWGASPFWFHLFNVLCHALNVILVFLVANQITENRRASFLAAALFAVHPVQVESVAWISGRTDLLACLFGLTALLASRRIRGLDGWSFATALLLALSTLAKEVGWVFLPLVLWQFQVLPSPGKPKAVGAPLAPESQRSALPEKRAPVVRWAPVLLAAFLGLTTRLVAIHGGAMPGLGPRGQLWTAPLRAATSAGYYLLMLVWPWNPSVLPAGRALAPPSSPLFWSGVLVLVLVPIAILRLRQRAPIIAFGLGWVALGLAPVLNVIPLSAPSPVAERFWYVPLAGVALLVASALERGRTGTARNAAGWSKVSWIAGQVGLVGFILASGFATIQRIPDWKTDLTLWEAELERHGLRHPLCARNLGQARLMAGDRKGAEAVWSTALAQGLGGGTVHYFDIGVKYAKLLLAEGRTAQAQELATRLLQLSPPDPAKNALREIVSTSHGPL